MNSNGVRFDSHSDFDNYYEATKEEELLYNILISDEESAKLKKLDRLIKSGVKIDFQSPSHNNNTALHIAVHKKELSIIKLLVRNEAKINIRNSRGETPISMAENLERADIICILNRSKQNGTLHQPIQETQEAVFARLLVFIEYFVKGFELKLDVYRMISERQMKKKGKIAETYSEALGQVAGAAIGGGIGFLLGNSSEGARIGLSVGGKGAELLGNSLGENRNKKRSYGFADLIYDFRKDKECMRKKLIEAGCDLFQSFEIQFMKVDKYERCEAAMQRLAEDAIHRALNYLTIEKEAFISKAAILGNSKMELKKVVIPKSGYSINCKDETGVDLNWNTSDLYSKVGLVVEENHVSHYYEKEDTKANIYGYRRLLMSESLEHLKKDYAIDTTKKQTCTDYNYVLSSKNMEELSLDILKKINLDDPDGKRIIEAIEEVKDDILRTINDMKEQNNSNNDQILVLLTTLEYNVRSWNLDKQMKGIKRFMKYALTCTNLGFKNLTKQIAKSHEEILNEFRKLQNLADKRQQEQLEKWINEIRSPDQL